MTASIIILKQDDFSKTLRSEIVWDIYLLFYNIKSKYKG